MFDQGAAVNDADGLAEAFGLLDVMGGEENRGSLFIDLAEEMPEMTQAMYLLFEQYASADSGE